MKPRIRYNEKEVNKVTTLMQELRLHTVCEEASCPNLGECFQSGTATFMILGKNCSRHCRFCDVNFGNMEEVNPHEPMMLASAVAQMRLNHVVITSVARDDLPDGGAEQFAACIREIRQISPETTVEILIPDFGGDTTSLDIVIAAEPDIINHNLETTRSLTRHLRHRATYDNSLFVLDYIKQKTNIYTKTGIMLGCGETQEEVAELMDDALNVGVDFLTIGQYLQPSPKHFPLKELIEPQVFQAYYKMGMAKGFKFVASSAQVRSSYKAHEALRGSGHHELHRN